MDSSTVQARTVTCIAEKHVPLERMVFVSIVSYAKNVIHSLKGETEMEKKMRVLTIIAVLIGALVAFSVPMIAFGQEATPIGEEGNPGVPSCDDFTLIPIGCVEGPGPLPGEDVAVLVDETIVPDCFSGMALVTETYDVFRYYVDANDDWQLSSSPDPQQKVVEFSRIMTEAEIFECPIDPATPSVTPEPSEPIQVPDTDEPVVSATQGPTEEVVIEASVVIDPTQVSDGTGAAGQSQMLMLGHVVGTAAISAAFAVAGM